MTDSRDTPSPIWVPPAMTPTSPSFESSHTLAFKVVWPLALCLLRSEALTLEERLN